MAINGDYPHPVTVNGFSCRNCTDVDYAKKHIDPAHPKDGPYGIDGPDRPSRHGPSVRFAGALAGVALAGVGATAPSPAPAVPSPVVDMRV